MTELTFSQLDRLFRASDFPRIENDLRGKRFLMLRSMSRRDYLQELAIRFAVDLPPRSAAIVFELLFEASTVGDEQIAGYLREKYRTERALRQQNEGFLIDQLARLQYFDWGGSHGNSLEKNIVNNYVKKIQSFARINEEIEGRLFSSLRGYTLNSWYNHWTSILIEDIFKDHPNVLPTVGLISKIDFFIHGIPFDLKVTYFPEELLAENLRKSGFGIELTELKRVCRRLNISIPADLRDKELKNHLYSKVSEDSRPEAKDFITQLRDARKRIVTQTRQNPALLKKWFYENQGETRFDASNRFFLVLIDESEMQQSWRLKRNVQMLREKVTNHLDALPSRLEGLETTFFWAKTGQTYSCKSDILFVHTT